jgi:hypothetical protein
VNALELMGKLADSGTGARKMDACRHAARSLQTTLKDMPGEVLLGEMKRRYARWRDLMDMGGPRRQGLVLPPECQPEACWPEGTIAKAERLLKGQPADLPPMAPASAVYDVDEAPPQPQPLAREEPEPPTPPGIHQGAHGPEPMAMPGVRHGGGRQRPRGEE